MQTILVTGAAGFIGSNLVLELLRSMSPVQIIGLDNMNNYYDVRLKEARLKELERFENFSFVKGNLADKAVIKSIFEQYKPEIVVNLGAQAGVRYSITNPDAYVEANLIGFYNILEACRHSYDEGHTPVEHLVYASSSSVYGSNKKVPYSTDDKVDNPVSLYAATKKSNELIDPSNAGSGHRPLAGAGFILYADVKNGDFMRTFEDLKPMLAMTNGQMRLVDKGENAFQFVVANGAMLGRGRGPVSFWLGVKDDRFYLTNQEDLIGREVKGLSLKDCDWAKDVKDKHFYLNVNFQALSAVLPQISYISMLDYLSIESDEPTKARLVLQLKDHKENVLKQLVQIVNN